ncbi:MAG: macrolide ABC transporter ATP-binding protein [Gammaproteobacteria bacterium SG8_15]|nr:MAG: macrolide ABC transporter ATP-binding protein [Gammaproteobacteria bacterium SG8_15]
MIQLQDVSKTYYLGEVAVPVLKHITLRINKGEFVAIMGPSGSGKSTLMNIIGCLDVADSGRYLLGGTVIEHLNESQLATIRNKHIGFVFQSFNLVPRISALRNVELPMVYGGVDAEIRRQRALMALQIVGLRERAEHSGAKMSGGQQQRVAIARAIVNNPDVIIADEPTGALDTKTGIEIMKLFRQLNNNGKTIVMVTHEKEIAAYAKRILYVRDGQVIETHLEHVISATSAGN